jgi:hypothetical protein
VNKSKSKSKTKRTTKAKGEPPRTARVRYIEPPTKKDGNPFFALRVPGKLLRAFKAHCKKNGTVATLAVREYMSKVTGVELESDNEEE